MLSLAASVGLLQRSRTGSQFADAQQMSRAAMSLNNEDAKIQMWLRGSNSTRSPLHAEVDEASDAEDDPSNDQGGAPFGLPPHSCHARMQASPLMPAQEHTCGGPHCDGSCLVHPQ